MQILINRNGQQFGPYTPEECAVYLSDGTLLPDDLAWHEGLSEWFPLIKLVEPKPRRLATPDPDALSDLKKTMKVEIPDEWNAIDKELPVDWADELNKGGPRGKSSGAA
ncbi:MAG: DUF4339 domain-containing protein [Verrucomicrobiae bacterium]|nr:DUF4339 domain-containing protein [Verrucomicrobiae bacterium]